ncbi:MAG: hypothetical protein NT155_00915 [Candidatus Staskawiczbacteria bacterium]|nr:hypothetical protein [Candidatus Staskawiczbacteria bacterium]
MNKVEALVSSQGLYIVVVLVEMVSVFRRSRDNAKEFFVVTVVGQGSVGANLIAAGKDAGLTPTDIGFVAHKLQIPLPEDAGIPDMHEPRGKANRFTFALP